MPQNPMPRPVARAVILALIGLRLAAPTLAAPPATAPATPTAATKPAAEKPARATRLASGTFSPLDADRIVFVCDGSGSLMTKFDALRVELNKTVRRLKPPQAFNIIFFRPTEPKSIGNRLIVANAESHQMVADFMASVAPTGATDPVPAIKKAFAMRPQAIFLLTDGDFPDNNEVIALLRELNKDKKVRIHTVAFLDHDEGYEKMLKRIADDSGGVFRYVKEEDLGE